MTAARIAGHSGATTQLDPASAIDLTASVDGAGVLHWNVPSGTWELFGFWQRATGQIAGPVAFGSPSVWSSRVPASSPGRYFLAGIFSSTGARAAVSYGASQLVGAGNLPALKASGASIFGDSLEVQAEIFWTSDFPRSSPGGAAIR